MDVRKIFSSASERLLADYRFSGAGISDAGGKGTLREHYFANFLAEYLPKRYAIGKGEVITPENRVSDQLDIVIYDAFRCPRLVTDDSHSVFTVESVFGAISVKSALESGDLKSGYSNIQTLKEVLPKEKAVHRNSFGFQWGSDSPTPVTGIFAYDSKRSLDAIAAQVADLDRALGSIQLRPDFVAVLGKGIVGPRKPLRGEDNRYVLPKDLAELALIRKTGRHTLLRLYGDLART